MPPTNGSSPMGSPLDCLPADSSGSVCAVHQPNLFPRMVTLAKLFTANFWIVLDDVQFTRRDYQHRARLAELGQPDRQHWLSIPTHLPAGRATRILDARLADPVVARRRTAMMIRERYRGSRHWRHLSDRLDLLVELFDRTDRLAEITEASTRLLLDMLGWTGVILRSSHLPARPDRTLRLVDLAVATGAGTYLCGTGGLSYLDPEPFRQQGLDVVSYVTPADGVWTHARRISGLWAIMRDGPGRVVNSLMRLPIAAT
jgi:hypothetical protein